MIRIEDVNIYGWEAAIRGMRNPKNSWNLSDTDFSVECPNPGNYGACTECKYFNGFYAPCTPAIGPNDLKLMKTLSKAGSDHGKYLRMITVTLDITAPLYWWKEFDTYKVGTVADSCSTMHKIHSKEFEIDDFSHEHLHSTMGESYEAIDCLEQIIDLLNKYRELYNETDDEYWWWQMIQLLPSSYNQRRTIQLNYQVLKNMYHARKNHKLDEWIDFCHWVESRTNFSDLIAPTI